ncbi:MAG TPA: aconitate hydratase AcnA [Candidatus Paceibacterota bacterium]|nr:aconitate hydratase AcnA [Verrucomicrobiota bacterium]HSA10074.1 aconitate hydratase AcnA [Candidatus Paceibacterota bacterium]
MSITQNSFGTLQSFDMGNGQQGWLHALPALERAGVGAVSRLPVSIRMVLESVLRNCDGNRVTPQNVRALANWKPNAPRTEEIPFVVARIVLQDFTGVPLLVDLAAMRSAVARLGRDPRMIEPLVPVDLVVDHSVQVDVYGTPDALARNLELEFKRNRERYQFLKWGMQAFDTFKVVPPGIGIVHQVNLEYLAKGVLSGPCNIERQSAQLYYPDTLVGTDSHTTMINGLGIVGWGVGGIEAEAGMLGQPVCFLTPDVVGVHLIGELREGVTATDLALTVTEMLRKAKVVGKFVEYFGTGAAALPVVDRATIANMAPEYGATMGFFPIDEECVNYLRATGRSEEHCRAYENYYRAQGMFGMPKRGQIWYSVELELDLGTVVPSVAGPKRPQDRIELPNLKREFAAALVRPATENGFGKEPEASSGQGNGQIGHGSVVIAAITSCTNTSNPSVMLAAGLLAKKVVERGLRVSPLVKTSLAPGSRVVSDYLSQTGLQKYFDQLGFGLAGYGCTTCIGNSGPLPEPVDEAIAKHDWITASVLSGNRNFEARIHQSVKANFLMSPPLVVAFAVAGRVDIDLTREPLGIGGDGREVYLKEVWPTLQEVRDLMHAALKPEVFRRLYRDFAEQNPKWNEIPAATGKVYQWDGDSTYIQEPPFLAEFKLQPGPIRGIQAARALAIFGDSVTTDHISPAGSIKKGSPAGRYLMERGVAVEDFNSYGSRRGNDRVMTRGTFANLRLKNMMVPGTEGGVTKHQPTGDVLSIFEAAERYAEQGTPLIVLAGQEYGTGSSRDWAAKGTALLGVRAVVAQSFERIHRSNLVGMGVLPLQFKEGVNPKTLKLEGTETFAVLGLGENLEPQQQLDLRLTRENGQAETVPVTCRIETPIEVDYYRHGGILPYILRRLVGGPGQSP